MVRFEVFSIDRGGGSRPQTLIVLQRQVKGIGGGGQDAQGTFATKAQADAFIRANRRQLATREEPVGSRAIPTEIQQAKKTFINGEEVTGPPPKGRPTTRTPAEQREIQQKAATLALKNIRAGKAFASPETIAKLQTQEKTQKQFVEERIIKRLTKGKTFAQFKTSKEIEQEKARARRERVERITKRITPPPTLETKGIPLAILGIPRKLKVTPPPPTRFEQLQKRISAISTQKIPSLKPEFIERELVKVRKQRILFEERVKRETGIRRAIAQAGVVIAKGERVVLGAELEARRVIREEPLTTGVFFLGGGGFQVLRRAARATKITKGLFDIGALGLGGAAIGITGVQVAVAPTPVAKGRVIGRAAVEFAAFTGGARAIAVGVPPVIRKVKEIKFERGVRAFERRITEPEFKFDPTREIFVPTGKRIIDIPTGRVIVEVEPIKRGFPVFGRAGEIVGRQLQLKPRFRPEVEPQAEFIRPALGIKRLPARDVFLGKFVERPLTPLQIELAREPPRVIRKVIERQKILPEFTGFKGVPLSKFFTVEFKEPRKPKFVAGVFQIGGLLPPIRIPPETAFERFEGEFFERVPKPRKIPKPTFEVIGRPKVARGLRLILPPEITPAARQRLTLLDRLKVIQKPIAKIDLKQLQKPIIFPEIKPEIRVTPRVTPIIEPKIRAKPKAEITPVLKPLPLLEPIQVPITKPIIKPRPVPRDITEPIPKPIFPFPILPPPPTIRLPKKARVGIKKPAFQPQVREGERKGDKFIDVGQRLPRKRAINKILRIVDNTTAASGRILRRGTTTLRDDRKVFGIEKFRGIKGVSKLPRNTFVEKRRFRIDSAGERLGISFSPSRIPRLREALAMKRARRVKVPRRRLPRPLTTGRGRVMRFL